MPFIKLYVFAFALIFGTNLQAQTQPHDWPTPVAAVGCMFEFAERGRHTNTLQIIEHMPFPEVRVQPHNADGTPRTNSLAALVGNTEPGRVISDLFCGGGCRNRDGLVRAQQKDLFPLAVGRSVRFATLLNDVTLSVDDKRMSPYLPGTREFKITAYYHLREPAIEAYWTWWNVEAGFYTERFVARNLIHEQLTGLQCPGG
ncbi:MAG: hypothetical protein AAF386_06590 [Pseudomonadota bacterium]